MHTLFLVNPCFLLLNRVDFRNPRTCKKRIIKIVSMCCHSSKWVYSIWTSVFQIAVKDRRRGMCRNNKQIGYCNEMTFLCNELQDLNSEALDNHWDFWQHCCGMISVLHRCDSRPTWRTGWRAGETGSGKTSWSQVNDGVHPEECIVKDTKLSQEQEIHSRTERSFVMTGFGDKGEVKDHRRKVRPC